MSKKPLINDLKLLLADLLEQEECAKSCKNEDFLRGLQYARVNLEMTLERNGYSRTSTIENEVAKLISGDFHVN